MFSNQVELVWLCVVILGGGVGIISKCCDSRNLVKFIHSRSLTFINTRTELTTQSVVIRYQAPQLCRLLPQNETIGNSITDMTHLNRLTLHPGARSPLVPPLFLERQMAHFRIVEGIQMRVME